MIRGVHIPVQVMLFAALCTVLMAGPVRAGVWPDVPTVTSAPFDAERVDAEDRAREAVGELPLYGRLQAVDAGSEEAGAWKEEGASRVWRARFSSPGALALEIFLDEVSMVPGSAFSVYSDEGALMEGPFDAGFVGRSGTFSTPLLRGEACVLEYREPRVEGSHGTFRIADVGHAYRDVEDGPCNVDAACSPEGDGWQDAATATVRISVVTSAGTGWCSGVLVNNVRQDCTPYVLSAWHCGSGSSTAQFNQYKFYFRYQRSTCGTGSAPTNKVLTGAQLRGFSNDNSGNAGSDFMLLELNNDIPSSFVPYWAGWDATPMSTSAADGVCMHHPTGGAKKVSSYTQTLTTGHWSSSTGLQSHWRLYWADTQNGFGITEHGSSGAPLFKPGVSGTAAVIGTLTGSAQGLSCDNTGLRSYFGKFSYHWTNNPNTAAQKLDHWLDPDGTGTLQLAGSADPCGAFVGVAEGEEQGALHVLPSPADGSFTLRLPVGDARDVLIATDVAGREVLRTPVSGGDNTVHTTLWKAGPYFLRLQRNAADVRPTRIMVVH